MNQTFPMSLKQIREEMKKVLEKIHEETKCDLVRNLSDVSITIGKAPEDDQDFGTVREPNSIVFGDWIEKLTPSTIQVNILEFLIIRAAFTFFIEEKTIFGRLSVITQYILNVLSFAYLRKAYDKKSVELKFVHIRSRFLFIPENLSRDERRLYNKKYELNTIVLKQSITFKLLLNTFLQFTEDILDEEIDFEEILDYLIRYLSNSPLEIAAPIRLKRTSLQVLEKLVDIGFQASTNDIANSLNLNQKTVFRELIRISSLYIASFRVEKNFYKLGLKHHLIIIKYSNQDSSTTEKILDSLKSNRYVFEIYSGGNSDFSYVYCLTLCPYIVAENLIYRLQRFVKEEIIVEFDVIPLKNRIFRSAFVKDSFQPSVANFSKLINGELKCTKLITWGNNNFEEENASRFTSNDKRLLWFMSLYQSNGIVNYNHYRGFTVELKEFLAANGFNWDDMQSGLDFLNKTRKTLLERKLIDFRLRLSLSHVAANESLIVKILCDPEDEKIKMVLDKLNIFGSSIVHQGYENLILSVFGLNYEHPLATLIIAELNKSGFDCEVFSVKNIVWRFVPLHKLYSFPDHKWLLK